MKQIQAPTGPSTKRTGGGPSEAAQDVVFIGLDEELSEDDVSSQFRLAPNTIDS